MSTEVSDRYETGMTPWDTGRPDLNLLDFLETTPLAPGKVLEIGCGTGANAILMASHGLDVLGVDLSPRAVELARQRAIEHGSAARFLVHDILSAPPPGGPFGFAFDRGCFHVFAEASARRAAVAHIAGALAPGGWWLSFIASADEPRTDSGPPRHTAEEVVAVVEPAFLILSLGSGFMDSDRPDKMRIWRLLARRRP